jgi:hypothetical protein
MGQRLYGKDSNMRTRLTGLRRWLFSREGALVALLLVAALAIRLPLMTFTGYYADLATYIRWGERVNQDFFNIYTSVPSVTQGGFPGGPRGGASGGINYPPGTPYLFGAVVYLYNLFASGAGGSPAAPLDTLVRASGVGPFIAKIPLLLADLASIALLYAQARKRHSERFALLASASYAFSPALLYNGAVWGQTDWLVALPVLGALFAVVSERYALGGVCLALAVLIKPQPAIFAPLALLYLWRWARREQFLAFTGAGLLTGLVFLLPVVYPHFQLLDMLRNMQAESYNDTLRLSSDAFNFWWLLGYSQLPIGTTVFGITAGQLGDLLFGAVTVLCGVQVWHHREPIYLFFGLSVQIFGFFMFMGGQHERYLFLFIPLMLASLIIARREESQHLINLYIAGTALCFLNMVVGVGGGRFASGQVIPFLNVQPLTNLVSSDFATLAMLLAFLHLGVFLYAAHTYLNGRFVALDGGHIAEGARVARRLAATWKILHIARTRQCRDYLLYSGMNPGEHDCPPGEIATALRDSA